MAGAGTRVFASGEILTAAQVNQYLMDQVITRFADAATRDASFGGVGQPVLSEGRFCYLDSTNVVQYYDGISWQDASQFTVGDGTITTAKLADDAVTSDKIADGAITSAHIADGTVIATDIADGSVTSAKILDGTIVNGDISASAGIALSKLATSTAGNIIVYNASGIPTAVAETGDVTIDSSGVSSISSGVIVNADISSSASIELGKLADVLINTKTANYTLALTDKNKIIEMNITATNNTVSVPTDASVDFPLGSQITVTQYGTGKTQIVAVSPGTTSIRATPGQYLRAQYSSATLIKRAANEWYLIGDLSAS